MKTWRLTRQAESSLVEIAAWTAHNFGSDRARAYENAIIARLNAVASGRPPHPRPCDVLMRGIADASGLVYVKEGRHFIVMRDTPDVLVVLDVLHERSDLPSHIDRLEGR